MPDDVQDKNVEVNGRKIGANSIIRMNVKTAVWLIGIVFTIVMGILTYSYFDLKGDYGDFVDSVNKSVETMKSDVTTIRVGQEGIKGDIKLILYRLDSENTVTPTTQPVTQPVLPPSVSNVVENDTTPPPE